MASVTNTPKARTLNRLYRLRGATEPTKKLTQEVETVVIETISGGHRITMDLADLFPDGLPPPCMGLAAAAFGLQTVIGNEIAGADKTDPQALADEMESRWEEIKSGTWSEGRSGPRINDVLDAWAADARERGMPVTDASIARMRERLLSGEVSPKDLLNQPAINAQHQAILTKRSMERLEKAKAAAAQAGSSSKYDDVFNA